MKLNKIKDELSYKLECIKDKIIDNNGKILGISTVLMIISMLFYSFFNDNVISPNFKIYPSSFNYTNYNKAIEKNNIANNVDINYNKIGYISITNNNGYAYKLDFGNGGHYDEHVYIYPSAEQLKQLKQIGESHTPILVIAKVTDSITSNCYNIEIENTEDNVEAYNQFVLFAQYAEIAIAVCVLTSILIAILSIVDVYQ